MSWPTKFVPNVISDLSANAQTSCSTNQMPGKGKNAAEHNQKLIRSGEGHNVFTKFEINLISGLSKNIWKPPSDGWICLKKHKIILCWIYIIFQHRDGRGSCNPSSWKIKGACVSYYCNSFNIPNFCKGNKRYIDKFNHFVDLVQTKADEIHSAGTLHIAYSTVLNQ